MRLRRWKKMLCAQMHQHTFFLTASPSLGFIYFKMPHLKFWFIYVSSYIILTVFRKGCAGSVSNSLPVFIFPPFPREVLYLAVEQTGHFLTICFSRERKGQQLGAWSWRRGCFLISSTWTCLIWQEQLIYASRVLLVNPLSLMPFI